MIIKCDRKNCENKFDKIVPHQKYCSQTCKQIAWALRQVESKRTFKIAKFRSKTTVLAIFLVSGMIFQSLQGYASNTSKPDFEKIADSITIIKVRELL